MPLIWDNVGNLNNLMVGPDGLVGIDQQVAVLADAARAAYLARVRGLVRAVYGAEGEGASGKASPPGLQRVAEACERGLQVAGLPAGGAGLGDAELGAVAAELRACFDGLRQRRETGELQAALAAAAACPGEWPARATLGRCIDFCSCVVDEIVSTIPSSGADTSL